MVVVVVVVCVCVCTCVCAGMLGTLLCVHEVNFRYHFSGFDPWFFGFCFILRLVFVRTWHLLTQLG